MINQTTYFEVLKWASSFLENNQKEPFMAEYLLLERKGWSKTDLLLHFKEDMPENEKEQYLKDLEQLVKDVPVQYLIGSAEFYGRRFLVTEATLIPRPETEELVDLILKDLPNEPLNIVDIGTGTGAIALSLSLERPNWQVTGIDISREALEVAKANSKELQAQVTFVESDVLEAYASSQPVDVIVSNPPYISLDEWDVMDESVRKFEPKQALFADNNGLFIYEKIAKESQAVLASTGRIYLEIGYLQGESVSRLFKEAFPKKEVEVIQDMNGQDRMIRVK